MRNVKNIMVIASFLIGTITLANVPVNELLKIIEHELILGDFENEQEVIEVATQIYHERNPQFQKEVELKKEEKASIMKKFDDLEEYYQPFSRRVF